jgi:hypothetical protein
MDSILWWGSVCIATARPPEAHPFYAGLLTATTWQGINLKLVIPEEIPDALCNTQAANVEGDLSRKSSEYLPGISVVILGFTRGRE